MIRLERKEGEGFGFTLRADQPILVEVVSSLSGMVAHVYDATNDDGDAEPIGSYDTSVPNQSWEFPQPPKPDVRCRGSQRPPAGREDNGKVECPECHRRLNPVGYESRVPIHKAGAPRFFCMAIPRKSFEASTWGEAHLGCMNAAKPGERFCGLHMDPGKRYGEQSGEPTLYEKAPAGVIR